MEKKINVTQDYSLFKRLEGNRGVTRNRAQKIKKSIQKVGYITSPILVNEKMEIIDGQGRFEALKDLGLPIEYIQQENLGIRECVAMNVIQSNWNLKDYILSYAEKGVQSYIYIKNIMDKYKIDNISIIATVTSAISRYNTKLTQSGLLEITEEQYLNALKKLDYFNELNDKYRDVKRFRYLFQAILYCTELSCVDWEKLKNRCIEVFEYGKIPPIPAIDEAIQFIEEIYNYNNKKEHVYIYTEYRKLIEKKKAKGYEEIQKKMAMYKYEAETKLYEKINV